MLEGDWEPSPAVRFHAGFYKARPDVNSVIHTHSHYVSVFATTRRTIGIYNVVSVLFYEDQAALRGRRHQAARRPRPHVPRRSATSACC